MARVKRLKSKDHSIAREAEGLLEELTDLKDEGIVKNVGLGKFTTCQGSSEPVIRMRGYDSTRRSYKVSRRGKDFVQDFYVEVEPRMRPYFEIYMNIYSLVASQ